MPDQPYEQPSKEHYSYFSKLASVLPQYVYAQLIGVNPQQRRAFLLQSRYLTPLSFTSVLLNFFFRYAVDVIIFHMLKAFYEIKGKYDPITFFVLIGIMIVLYFLFKSTQNANTRTLKEEFKLQTIMDSISFALSIYTVWDINLLWTKFFAH